MAVLLWVTATAALVVASKASAVGQEVADVPEWRLGPIRLQVGHGAESLYRVTGSVLLGDGNLAIADAGNHWTLVISSAGETVLTRGGRGEGPGEFEYLGKLLLAGGDTVVAVDHGLQRLTVWSLGTPEEPLNYPYPRIDDHWPSVGGIVGRYWPQLDSIQLLERRPVEKHFVLTERHGSDRWGSTGYAYDPLGAAHFAASDGYYSVMPHEGDELIIGTGDGASRRVRLPVRERLPVNGFLEAYGDSLLSRTASRRDEERIRRMYDAGLPLPRYAPVAVRLVAMGPHFWVEAYRGGTGGSGQWYVIDPVAGSVVASISVPDGERVLPGNGEAVVLLTRSALDEELVVVRELRK